MTEKTVETIAMPKRKMEYLDKAIEKLNKRAVKLGCEPMVLEYDNPHTYTYTQDPYTGEYLPVPRVVEMIDATLTYIIPRINGYKLIAVLDIFGDGDKTEVLVSGVPGETVPSEYKHKKSIDCDHCGYIRNRYHSVLLQHEESGEYKEVGSTCVKDFFGHDPRGLLMFASIRFVQIIDGLDDDDFEGFGGRPDDSYNLLGLLRYTAAAIAEWGWISKSKAYEEGCASTYDLVLRALGDPSVIPPEYRLEPSDEDRKIAEESIQYFLDIDAGDNDYLTNCQKIANLGYVPWKYGGYACSMVASYQRHLQREIERKNELPSKHIGSIGERLKDIPVKCLFWKDFPSDFGVTTLYTFQDKSGNIFKTFYSGSKWEAEGGTEYLLTGTVKKHGEFREKKENLLTRCIIKGV